MPDQQREGKPDSASMFRNTHGTVWDWATRTANAATGGNKAVAGWVDVHPDTVKSLWRTVTGGTGSFITDSIQLANIKAQGAEAEWKEIPVIRDFYKEPQIGDTRKSFWEEAKDVQRAQGEFATAKKNLEQVMLGKDGAAQKDAQQLLQDVAEKDRALIALGKAMSKFQKAVTIQRDQIDAMMNDTSVPLQERRVKAREMEVEEKRLYDRFIELVKAQKTEEDRARESRRR